MLERSSSYEYEPGKYLRVHDAVWGSFVIGEEPRDQVYLDLMENALVKRAMHIEQLTLDPAYATIPNTGNFTRFEHVWGSLGFVRMMIASSTELMGLSEEEKLHLELRTFVSDLGQTAFSHLGDWITQGFGGSEDAHDLELPFIMEASGANDVLRAHGISPEAVIFPATQDWIERPSPGLCVDRVDYACREALRWMVDVADTSSFCGPEAFRVVNGSLVMSDRHAAEQFWRMYSILPTEHWQHPVHRLQLWLLESMVRRVLVHDLAYATWGDDASLHPRDALYAVDIDFMTAFNTSDEYLWSMKPIIEGLAYDQRRIFRLQRQQQLRAYFLASIGGEENEYYWNFPDPLRPFGWAPSVNQTLAHTQLEIIPVRRVDEIDDFNKNPYTVDVFLPPLKPRYVDPLFIEGNSIERLSDVDLRYKQLMSAQQQAMGQAYIGRIAVNPTFRAMVIDGLDQNARLFPALDERVRLTTEEMGCLLQHQWQHRPDSSKLQFIRT